MFPLKNGETLDQLLAPGFDPDEWAKLPVATKGLPASPGAASGQVVFTADHAVEWSNRGEPVILVRRETVPDDIHGMWVSQGVLTATGGMTSHAAVVGRQMGKPSIVGAGELRIDEHGKTFTVKGKTEQDALIAYLQGLGITTARLGACPSLLLDDLPPTQCTDPLLRGGTLISVSPTQNQSPSTGPNFSRIKIRISANDAPFMGFSQLIPSRLQHRHRRIC